jgi:hypothetical protein
MKTVGWILLMLPVFAVVHLVWIFLVIPAMLLCALLRIPADWDRICPVVVAPLVFVFDKLGLYEQVDV